MSFVNDAYANCSSPAGPAGRIEYFSASEQVFKYCDGANWQPWVKTLDSLGDVATAGAAAGNVLLFSGGSWIPGTVGGGGGGSMPTCADGDSAKYSPVDGWVCAAAYDNTPAGFVFTDQVGVALSTLILSDIKQITGILGNIAISISGTGSPQFRVCSDSSCSSVVHDWSTSGSIQNNQYLQLRLTSDPADGVVRSATVAVGPTVTDNWSVRTIYDDSPDAFNFTDVTLQPLTTQIASNSLTITGITSTVNVSVSGAGSPQIRINGGSWVTSGTITNGQTLEVRLTSAGTASTLRSATVTLGTGSNQWDVTTWNTTPDTFSFTDVTVQPLNTVITSNSLTITGIIGSLTASVSGAGSPQIRINGGSWVASGTITNGQTLEVRLTSANASSTLRSATVTVGAGSDQWDVTTQDATPNSFTFTDVTIQPQNILITSDSVTINGITGSVPVSVSGTGSPQVRVNGGSWTAGPTTITDGQTLEVQLTSASTDTTARTATVTVGTLNDVWSVTTQDISPSGLNFTDVLYQTPGTLVASNIVTIGSLSGNVATSISGTGSPEYRICTAADCSVVSVNWTSAPGTITTGTYLQLRLTTSASVSTMHSATMTVGSGSNQWDVTTLNPGLYAWGDNFRLPMGLSSQSTVTTPTLADGATNWSVVSSGEFQSCGIKGGALYCWGQNSAGMTGLGTSSGTQATPAQVGSFTDWTVVSAAHLDWDGHTCGIRGGTLYCWGDNATGRTGLGITTGLTTSPTQVGSFTNWTTVSAGAGGGAANAGFTCGIRGGALYCWGANGYGVTGLGLTSGNTTTPTQVGSFTDWTAVFAGTEHACGIRGGALYCWGNNAHGGTGLGITTGNTTTPTQVGSFTNWTAVSVGGGIETASSLYNYYACGIRGGALYCWGANANGRTGFGTATGDQTTPAQVGSNTDWTNITTGVSYYGPQTCGIRNGGALYCWGSNGYNGTQGKNGLGAITADQLTPVLVSSGGWTVVSAGTDHTEAIFAP